MSTSEIRQAYITIFGHPQSFPLEGDVDQEAIFAVYSIVTDKELPFSIRQLAFHFLKERNCHPVTYKASLELLRDENEELVLMGAAYLHHVDMMRTLSCSASSSQVREEAARLLQAWGKKA